MRIIPRFIAISTIVSSIFVVVTAAPAMAAAPANDTFGGSVTIASLPFDATVDTTEATTDADDAETNINCGAPATDASVWYSFTPAADGAVFVDVSSSDYSAGVIVVTGAPGSFSLETCGPGTIAFFGLTGVTYHILLFDDQQDGAGNGGTLNLSVFEAPPPPSVSATVDPKGQFNAHTGQATISGTATCSGLVDIAEVDVNLRQDVGRVATVEGTGFASIVCDGTAHPWSVDIAPFSGQFRGGKAASVTLAIACGPFECSTDFQVHRVQLSNKK
jgi:hypothetical protein